MGFFTNRVQVPLAQHAFDLCVIFACRGPDFEPLRFPAVQDFARF
jgi:hypothetical protein